MCRPLLALALIHYHTEQTETVRASGFGTPITTVDASNRYGLTCANLVEYYSNGRPLDVAAPMHTITSHDREALAAVHVQKFFSGVDGADVNSPLPTVTAIDHNSVCAAHIAEFKGQDKGQSMDRPLRTITASIGEFAEVQTKIVQYTPFALAVSNRHTLFQSVSVSLCCRYGTCLHAQERTTQPLCLSSKTTMGF